MIMAILTFLIFLFTICLSIAFFKMVWEDNNGSFISTVLSIGFSIIVTIFAFFIAFMIFAGMYTAFEATTAYVSETKTCQVNIVSMNYSEKTEGHFTLGTGSIDGKQYYACYEDLGNDKYTRFLIPTENVTIQEQDANTPNISWTENTYEMSPWIGCMLTTNSTKQINYIFNVPKGTIVKEFKL